MKEFTKVLSKEGSDIHLSYLGAHTLCGKRSWGRPSSPRAAATCKKCIKTAKTF